MLEAATLERKRRRRAMAMANNNNNNNNISNREAALEMRIDALEKENNALRHRSENLPLSPNAATDRMRRENGDLRQQLAQSQQVLKDMQMTIRQLPQELQKQFGGAAGGSPLWSPSGRAVDEF